MRFHRTLRSSPLLEIQVFDTESENAGKNHREHHWHGDCSINHVIPEPKCLCYKFFHHFRRPTSYYVDKGFVITKLCCNHPIQCPCNRTRPVIPSPPLGYVLQVKDNQINQSPDWHFNFQNQNWDAKDTRGQSKRFSFPVRDHIGPWPSQLCWQFNLEWCLYFEHIVQSHCNTWWLFGVHS